jgi:membrane protease YdiL (CAAX protease family)
LINSRIKRGRALPEITDRDRAKHWGLLATLLWGTVIAAAYVAVGTIAAGIYVGVTQGARLSDEYSEAFANIQYDGMAISVSTFATVLICGLLIIVAIKCKRGSDLKEYLGLTVPSKRETGRWLLFFIGFLIVLDLVTYLLGKPIVPEFMWRVYSSLESRWVLWIALLVAAPLIEELFFRGFLIKGLAASPLGAVGAVVLTSAAWALIHVQYDAYSIGAIFIMGMILGAARITTGSTMLPIFLHSVANFVATVETAIYLSYFGANG